MKFLKKRVKEKVRKLFEEPSYKYAMKEETMLKLNTGNRPHIEYFEVAILEQKIWIQE